VLALQNLEETLKSSLCFVSAKALITPDLAPVTVSLEETS
jgi:hypothetical protein